jgi:hypothetical protein
MVPQLLIASISLVLRIVKNGEVEVEVLLLIVLGERQTLIPRLAIVINKPANQDRCTAVEGNRQ